MTLCIMISYVRGEMKSLSERYIDRMGECSNMLATKLMKEDKIRRKLPQDLYTWPYYNFQSTRLGTCSSRLPSIVKCITKRYAKWQLVIISRQKKKKNINEIEKHRFIRRHDGLHATLVEYESRMDVTVARRGLLYCRIRPISQSTCTGAITRERKRERGGDYCIRMTPVFLRRRIVRTREQTATRFIALPLHFQAEWIIWRIACAKSQKSRPPKIIRCA